MSRSNSGAVCDFEERAEKGASVGTTETDEARKDKEEKRMKRCPCRPRSAVPPPASTPLTTFRAKPPPALALRSTISCLSR
ncbi:uncharacterized protein LOC123499725 isoform X4 [Portunus trituberculatus]|uniref:uncharacterized protein LOC123499725 isoform X4 n=1 Tax=Portunus trituberculatus TaxID=210409 RepID=UPI001E1CEE82|nr:uncharacterized protein LOC123499725 isoform X4 [Portunus trituberculatus]